jgi:apolipoprotein N-acyltransferase
MKFHFKLLASIVSGLCWYFANDLSGNYWYLLWIAPIPVLISSFRSSLRQTFFISFSAYLLGRLSWLPYLLSVLPRPLAILFTVLLPLIFSLIVILTRKIVLQKQGTWSAFAFPVFCSLFEFIAFKFSPDGTAGSLAYTQSNFLPIVQIASMTGILGITFLVTLFPSVLAVAAHYRFSNMKKLLIFIFSIVFGSLLFGMIRLNSKTSNQGEIIAGLAVVDEKFHSETDRPDSANEIRTAKLYASEIFRLSQQGAAVIVLPEKMVTVTPATETVIKNILLAAAKSGNVAIVAGYTTLNNDHQKENKALAISSNGNVIGDYQKVNLFEGEVMSGFVPGKQISIFNMNNIASGVAICKDMDYPGFIRKYKERMVFYVPAWDFVKDGWLHSRMAILRGVENGYAIVRTARQGELTISDHKGRVLYEASCVDNKAASLIARFPLYSVNTIYHRFGDWFGFVVIIAAIFFVLRMIRRKK